MLLFQDEHDVKFCAFIFFSDIFNIASKRDMYIYQ